MRKLDTEEICSFCVGAELYAKITDQEDLVQSLRGIQKMTKWYWFITKLRILWQTHLAKTKLRAMKIDCRCCSVNFLKNH